MDASYTNLEVKQRIVARTIRANEIQLNDTTLVSNIGMAGARIKCLYEAQANTNSFTDKYKRTIEKLSNAVTVDRLIHLNKPVFFALPLESDIDERNIPINAACICRGTRGGLVYKCNIDEVIQTCVLPLSPPVAKTVVRLEGDSLSVDITENHLPADE